MPPIHLTGLSRKPGPLLRAGHTSHSSLHRIRASNEIVLRETWCAGLQSALDMAPVFVHSFSRPCAWHTSCIRLRPFFRTRPEPQGGTSSQISHQAIENKKLKYKSSFQNKLETNPLAPHPQPAKNRTSTPRTPPAHRRFLPPQNPVRSPHPSAPTQPVFAISSLRKPAALYYKCLYHARRRPPRP